MTSPILDAVLPPGVALQPSAPCPQHKQQQQHHHHDQQQQQQQQQLGLVATRAIEANELIFQGRATLIDAPVDCEEAAAPYALITVWAADGAKVGSYPISLARHTTRLPGSATRRLLHDGVASFMNHACDPSTVVEAAGSEAAAGSDGAVAYDVKAARRLRPGEELTCDYTLAEYDATEKGMDPCCCGAPAGVCLGSVRGFKYLSLEQQLARLGRVSDPLFAQFQRDHAQDGARMVVVLDAREGPPVGVFLDLGGPPRVLTTRAVLEGEVLYEERSRLVRPLGGKGEGASPYTYPRVILVVGPHTLPLDPLALFSSAYDATGTREVYGLDVLMRHACGAKATTEWTWETAPHDDEHPQLSYRVCAARALQAGEELTVDLRTLAWRGLRGVRRRVSEGERASGVSLPAPAVGALGFECQCCGRPVFR